MPTLPMLLPAARATALLCRMRGGAAVPAPSDQTQAAVELFSNMRVPAALIAGAILPVGFAAAAKPVRNEDAAIRVIKIFGAFLAIFTLSSELITVVYSTIAVNKLKELPHEPASSVTVLLARDYEMEWLGVNVHFFGGLISLASVTSLFVWLNLGARVGKAAALAAASAVSLMLAVVNNGIAKGDGSGSRFGSNLLGLTVRYLVLLVHNGLWRGPRALLLCSIALALAATVAGAQAICDVFSNDFE